MRPRVYFTGSVALPEFRRRRKARTFLTVAVAVSHPVGISQYAEVLDHAGVYSDMQHVEE